MTLNFYNSIYGIINLVIYIFFITIFITSKESYTDFVDVYSRSFIFDFYSNNYYYFWTSFWYIPTMVFSILMVSSVYNNFFYKVKLKFIITLVSAFFIYEVFDYWNMNLNYNNYSLNSGSINMLLTNCINKYHPYLFYYSIIIYSSLSLTSTISYTPELLSRFNISISFKKNSILKLGRVFIIILTLWLGSWWALQEGSWGGWWNWDPSEVFGMVVMWLSLITIHGKNSFTNLFYINLNYKIGLFTILFMYIFIQLNFNLVSHNFGIKVTDFVNTSQFFSIYILFITCFIVKIVFNILNGGCKYLASNQYVVLQSFKFIKFFYILLTLQISILVVMSFYPLINDFSWKIININTLNWFLYFDTMVIYALITTLLYLLNISSYLSIIFLVTSFYGSWYSLIIICIIWNRNLIEKVHSLILIFILNCVFNYYSIDSNWYINCFELFTDASYNLNLYLYDTYSVSNNNLYSNTPTLINGVFSNTNTIFYSSSTSPDIGNFYLSFYGNFLYQNLGIGLLFYKFYIVICDMSIVCLCELLIIILSGYLFVFRKNLLIVS